MISADRAAGTVLGLREQVGRDPRGVDGVVGDDRDLRRAGEPSIADDGRDLALGLGDVRVARADDHVDRGDASRCRTRARRSPARRRPR